MPKKTDHLFVNRESIHPSLLPKLEQKDLTQDFTPDPESSSDK
jgi:hypothetical protein